MTCAWALPAGHRQAMRAAKTHFFRRWRMKILVREPGACAPAHIGAHCGRSRSRFAGCPLTLPSPLWGEGRVEGCEIMCGRPVLRKKTVLRQDKLRYVIIR